MIRSVAVGLAVLLFASVAVAPAVATAGADSTRLGTPDGFSQTVFTIQVNENGSAQWTFEYSRPLANNSEREQFQDFAAEFEANESTMYRNFVDRSAALTDGGSDVTGREMTASSFSRSASVEEITAARGVVTMSFTWSNFGVVDGDVVRVGDVFEGGLYIGENQRLVFEAGPSVAFTNAAPESYTQSGESLATSDSVTWVGEQQFTDQRPKAKFQPASAVGNGTTGTDGGTAAQTTDPTTESNSDMLVLVGVFVVVIGLVGAAVWQSGAFSDRGGVASDGAAEAAADQSTPDPEPTSIPDEELLSDNDRVVKLLEDNGGRMKQVNIVDETDWSKSKVSMLLSEMEDDGDISKLRVGRENIISLAGEEPDAAGSPFDDEE